MATAMDLLRAQVATKWQESFNRINRNQPGIRGLMSVAEAWNTAVDFMYPMNISHPRDKVEIDKGTARAAFDLLSKTKMLPMLLDTFLDNMRKQQHLITEEVRAYMRNYERKNDADVIRQMIHRLIEWYNAWKPLPELGQTVTAAYTLHFQTHLYSVLPPSFAGGFKHLVSSTLTEFPVLFPSPSDPGSLLHTNPVWSAFETLGLVDRYESMIASVFFERIEEKVLGTCRGVWCEPMLADLRTWLATEVMPCLVVPYAKGATTVEEARNMTQSVGSRFDFHVCKTLCDLRTSEIFEIIIDYPESTPALTDLKECLARVDQSKELVQALRKANKRRLLHPGADTKLIIEQYVSIIRCMRMLDPQGILLVKVADPIRRYLRERPDTIRCIVASLVGDDQGGTSLVDENEPIQPLNITDAEDYGDPNWEPEPIDAGPEFRTQKPSDIIGTLVGIFEGKDLFVKELQVLLAQRLLAVTDGNYDKERRNVEILKVRFGDAALQVCEVMLRDMTDSRRIDVHVQSQKSSILHPTIISRHFWPTLQSQKLEMPPQMKQIQDDYAKEFATFKPDKKLQWMSHLGTVSLDVKLQDRTVSAEVTPVEAAIVELFSEKDTWTVDDIAKKVGNIGKAAAIKALATWLNLQVLNEEEEGTFRLLETIEEGASRPVASTSKSAAVAEEAVAEESAEQQQAQQMKICWKYIEGMLTNIGALSLDRIQNMLKLVPDYDRNIDQLGELMEAARREGLVTVTDGMWKLRK